MVTAADAASMDRCLFSSCDASAAASAATSLRCIAFYNLCQAQTAQAVATSIGKQTVLYLFERAALSRLVLFSIVSANQITIFINV